MRTLRVTLALAAVLAFVGLSSGGYAQTTPPVVSFVTPSTGAVVAGPRVEVALEVRGLNLVEAGSLQKEGDGHAHVLVDVPPPAPRSFLSTSDPRIVHFGKPPFRSRPVALANGEHTLTAVLGDSEHLVVDGQRTAQIKITVADGYRGKGTLSPACSNLATGLGEVRLTFPNDGGTVQGTITSRCAFQTQSNACTWLESGFSRVEGTFGADTQHITARTVGATQRKLRSGDRKSCGEDRESSISPSVLQADVDGDSVNGTVNEAKFTLARDDSVDLASAPDPLEDATTTSGANSKRKLVAYIAFALAAMLLAFAAVSVLRIRSAARVS
jgi:hypothetical protein